MLKSDDIVYYSMQYPNIINTPKKRDNSSNLSDAYEVKTLLDKYITVLKNNDLNLYGNILHDMIHNVKVNAFHPHPERYSRIQHIEKMLESNKRFSQCSIKNKQSLLASHSPFFNGIFQIKP